MRNKIVAISFALILPAIVAVGAYVGMVVTPLLLIAAICVVIVLVALGKIKGRLIYPYIFGISLGLIWQTTMMGVDVIGSDIHNEFYFAKLNLTQPWDYSMRNTDNASFVIWFIAPWLSKLLMLDMLWIFKAVLPLFLAFVPIVLFSVFKRQFGETRAFFATIFFMIIPVFSMEIASIAKSMVAELFFALMVWIMVSDWRWPYKTAGICGSLAMAIACHYTVGFLGICFLLGMLLVRLVSSPLKWGLFANRKMPLATIMICLVVSCGAFWGYHNHTAKGIMYESIEVLVFAYVPKPTDSVPIVDDSQSTIADDDSQSTIIDGSQPDAEQETQPSPSVSEPRPSRFSFELGRATLVEAAIGLDFMEVPLDGKIFRIVQFLTQLMIIIGVGRLIWAYKKYNVTAEFVGFVATSGFLLLACIFLLGFADTINMTRFYHISLFFISPMFVLGCETLASMGRKK